MNMVPRQTSALAITSLVSGLLGWLVVAISVLTVLAFVFFFGGLAVLFGLLGLSGQL